MGSVFGKKAPNAPLRLHHPRSNEINLQQGSTQRPPVPGSPVPPADVFVRTAENERGSPTMPPDTRKQGEPPRLEPPAENPKPKKRRERRDDTLNLSDEMVEVTHKKKEKKPTMPAGPAIDDKLLDEDVEDDDEEEQRRIEAKFQEIEREHGSPEPIRPHNVLPKPPVQKAPTTVSGRDRGSKKGYEVKDPSESELVPLPEMESAALPEFTVNKHEISSIHSDSEEEEEQREEFKKNIERFDVRQLTTFNWGLEGSAVFRTISFKFKYSPMHKGFRIYKSYNKFLFSKMEWRIDPIGNLVKFLVRDDHVFNLGTGEVDKCKGVPIRFDVSFDGDVVSKLAAVTFMHLAKYHEWRESLQEVLPAEQEE
jgi:hypothetical protein